MTMEKVITAIKVQKRNPNRVNIELDGEYAFGLSRIVAAWLEIGARLDDEKIKSLCHQDSIEVATQKALLLLNYRPRTEKEIKLKLAEKGFETDQVEQVIEKLTNAGLVHDEKYAQMWVENRNEFHPRSQRLIRYELKGKGIADDLIDNALEGSAEDSELAFQAAAQYARRLSDLDWPDFRKRLSAFLARRGFSYGTIAPVVQSIWDQRKQDPGITRKNEEYENGKSK